MLSRKQHCQQEFCASGSDPRSSLFHLLHEFLRVLVDGIARDEDLAIGLIRFHHHKKEGKIPQVVVTIASMDIDRMIEYMMETYNIDTKYGELLVKTIRLDSQQRVKDHLGVNVITPDRV